MFSEMTGTATGFYCGGNGGGNVECDVDLFSGSCEMFE